MELRNHHVSGTELADLIGITDRQVRNLHRANVLHQAGKGKYPLAESLQAYIAYAAHGKVQSEVIDSKSRLLSAQARNAEIEADRKAGKLLDLDDVQTVLNETMTIIASQMDGLGGRLANELAGESDPAIIRQKLLSETRRIRATAADKLARLGAIADSGRDSAPAARQNTGPVGKRKTRAATGKRGARPISE